MTAPLHQAPDADERIVAALAEALCHEFSVNKGLPLGQWVNQDEGQRAYWRLRAEALVPTVARLIEDAVAERLGDRDALVAAFREAERILTARAERAEAQVERVRGLLRRWEAWDGSRGRDGRSHPDASSPRTRALLRAALAETETGRQEGSEAPSAAQEGEVAPGGRDELDRLREALDAAHDFVTWDSRSGIFRALTSGRQIWPIPEAASEEGL